MDILPSTPSAASVPSNLPPSPSYTSLALSEGGVLNYASTLVQEPNSIDLLSQSDIIIAYVDPLNGTSTYVSETENVAVSWAPLGQVKAQSVFCALILVNLTYLSLVVY